MNHYKVVNMMEKIVADTFEQNLKEIKISCACETCKKDIYALTLNFLTPRYVSNDQGGTYVKAQFMNEQYQTDILCAMTKAATIVSTKPRH